MSQRESIASQSIQVRGGNRSIPERSNVTIAKVIGQKHHNVGLVAADGGRMLATGPVEQKNEEKQWKTFVGQHFAETMRRLCVRPTQRTDRCATFPWSARQESAAR